MSKQSPLQIVRDAHGSKAKLAEKVAGILAPADGEEQEEFEHRINTMANTKLLRLWNAQQTLSAKHGSREALVGKIVKARFPGGNADYAAKLGTYSVPRLLDLARQHAV